MTPLEAEALLIRLNGAVRLVEHEDEHGRWELLAMVVEPSQAVLEASLTEAETRGVSNLAWSLSRMRPSKPARPVTFRAAPVARGLRLR